MSSIDSWEETTPEKKPEKFSLKGFFKELIKDFRELPLKEKIATIMVGIPASIIVIALITGAILLLIVDPIVFIIIALILSLVIGISLFSD